MINANKTMIEMFKRHKTSKPRIRAAANGAAKITFFDGKDIPNEFTLTILHCWVDHLNSIKGF